MATNVEEVVATESVVENVTENVVETPVLNEVVEKEKSGAIVGQVKWFSAQSGYGFVTISEGDKKGQDIFAIVSLLS